MEFIRLGGRYFIYPLAALYYLLRLRNKYDVIIDAGNGIPFFTPLYIRNIPILLLIHHVHQEIFFTQLKFPFSWIARTLEAKVMPPVYRNIPIVCVSKSTKKDIMKYKIKRKNDIYIIKNGIDTTKYFPVKNMKKKYITYLGRLRKYKSIDTFLRAIPLLLDEYRDMKFLVAGHGDDLTRLKKIAEKLNISNKVKFTGKVSDKKKIDLIRKSHMLVNPSQIEGWGITVLEANACQVPVIGADSNGLREAIKNGRTGLLFKHGDYRDLADKSIKLLREKRLLTKYSINSYNYAKLFSTEKSAEQFIRLFKSIRK
ncbi:MAG: Glycosyltransferase [Candidatus Gottesmanbacteria bacterium GW2011_GWC2_39_8]|uniref:Glycosyltransferase n=1 Tax=Candidatus Gottesmanbacteria bacterium GW2011_GWC2_39_8 TaxID=1618450 RepID=A0A0G0Q4T0_9BACT|nr:MAG: Glycosyltransferase [Candidatus Gottesmanbacteria bacterium GW2011_GWC2_39_8]